MSEKEKLFFQEEKVRGKPFIREMFGRDDEGEVWLGARIVHPGAEFYKIGPKNVFFRLTKRGREIMRVARNQARGVTREEELEIILRTTLGRLFYRGETEIGNLSLSTRVYNLLRRISRSSKVNLQSFLLEQKGLPPLLWVGAFAFWTETDLDAIHGMGPGSREEIVSILREYKIPLPTERVS